MAQKHPLKYRLLRKKLAAFGIREVKRRGKGSHRMFVGIVDGRTVKYPVTCHSENADVLPSVIEAIRRAFLLTADDGVSDNTFYGK